MTRYLPGIRLCFFLIFLFSVCAMASMLYMQYGMGFEPCYLCIVQRVFMIGLGLVALLAAIHNPKHWGRRIYAGLGGAVAIGGAFFAGRHVWIQNLPEDQVPVCGPGYDYLRENFPIIEVAKLLMRGDGNCHEIVWSFLGLSIPGWSFVGFTCITVVFAWQLLRSK